MGGRLVKNVVLRHPESGQMVGLVAGDEVPGWAEPLITNPAVYEQADAEPVSEPEEKPRARRKAD